MEDVLKKNNVWQCYPTGSVPFIIITFIYLCLLQFAGIILAFQTCKVNIKALNDSKSVTVLIYISSIVLVIMALVQFILRNYINIQMAVFSGGVIIMATLFLVLIFTPNVSENEGRFYSYHNTYHASKYPHLSHCALYFIQPYIHFKGGGMCICICLQMVNLYRDPSGEMIFSVSVTTFTKQSTHTNNLTMSTRVFDQTNVDNINSIAD